MRAPIVVFGLAPSAIFFVGQRFPRLFGAQLDARLRRSVHGTSLGILVLFVGIVAAGGWRALLLVHLPATMIAASAGVFLFYVQHQFERPYWARRPAWSYLDASLDGASYLRLPGLLQWFSGSIGFHHIHHLAPGMPNYALQKCHDENPALRATTTLSLRDALRTARLKLFDERTGTMVGFAEARRLLATRGLAGA